MANAYSISMSALETFRRCPKKYEYSYIKGLETPPTENMRFGLAFHASVAARYTGHNWEEEVCRYCGEDDEMTTKVRDVANYYWENVGSKDEFQVLTTEKLQTVPFSGVDFRFKFDLSCKWKNRLWIIDHKTVTNVNQSMSFLPLDFQVNSYLWAAYKLYGEGVGLMYNMVRREVPPGYGSRSDRTPTGKISKASRDVNDYLRREYIVPSAQEIAAFEEELSHTLAAWRAAHYPRSTIRDGSAACEFCPYFALCCSELRGNKVKDSTLSLMYNMKKEK